MLLLATLSFDKFLLIIFIKPIFFLAWIGCHRQIQWISSILWIIVSSNFFMPILRSVYPMSGKYLIGISLNSGKLCENSARYHSNKQIEKKWISKWWDPDALGSQLCCYRKIQRIGMVGLSSFHHWMTKLISFSDNWKSCWQPEISDCIY